MRRWALTGLLATTLFGSDASLENLFQQYEKESDLSNITKQESAGIIDIFTRSDLQKMQARTLLDILKTLPTMLLTRTSNNLWLFETPSGGYLSSSAIRIYINDHELTSASFGSSLLIWADMPVEAIDHIEIYKGASAIAFGNEPGLLIIRLYTKDPRREEDGKLKVWGGEHGSYQADGYVAHTLDNGLRYFFYANGLYEGNDAMPFSYTKRGYDLHGNASIDRHANLFYASLGSGNWQFEAGHYRKKVDNFLGLKLNHDGGLEAEQSYLNMHLHQNGYRFDLSYDWIDYEREYKGGLPIPMERKLIDDYRTRLRDQIFNISLEKSIRQGSNELLLGGFYKNKQFHQDGRFDADDSSGLTSDYETALNLFSLYLEDRYDFDVDHALIVSLKGDYYDYESDTIDDKLNWSARIGYIAKSGPLSFKCFLTHTYLATAMYKLYKTDGIPYRANPNLKYTQATIASSEVSYSLSHHRLFFRIRGAEMKDPVVYTFNNPEYNYINSDVKPDQFHVTLGDIYQINPNHRLYLAYFAGKNDTGKNLSPRYGAIVRLNDTFGSFDLYNELNLYGPYDYPVGKDKSIHEDFAVEYTAALSWHINDDLTVAIKGENIFNDGYRQVCHYIDRSYPVIQQKVWINMEYLF